MAFGLIFFKRTKIMCLSTGQKPTSSHLTSPSLGVEGRKFL